MKNIFSCIFSIIIIFCFSLWLSHRTYATDFPVYYAAAKAVLDKSVAIDFIYKSELIHNYPIPEHLSPQLEFIYSLPVAYIMAPLALMPYYMAKTVMIFTNILMYLVSVTIALRLAGATGRSFFYPLVLSILWMPFIQNLRFAQVNAILLFVLTIAVLAAARNRPILCGTLLGFATLIKLFPIAIAMTFGIKNWRIFLTCIVVVGASFLIPGSLEWLTAVKKVYPGEYTPIYLLLINYNIFWFLLYSATVATISAIIVYQKKELSYPSILSFTIPAMFLTMPLVEYYHLTILIFSFVYLFITYFYDKIFLIFLFISFVIINIQFNQPTSFLAINSLFIIWVYLCIKMVFTLGRQKKNAPQNLTF